MPLPVVLKNTRSPVRTLLLDTGVPALASSLRSTWQFNAVFVEKISHKTRTVEAGYSCATPFVRNTCHVVHYGVDTACLCACCPGCK